VVGGSFQSVDHVCFRVYWEEVESELLLKVPLGWYGENTGVRFLMEDVLGPLGGTTILEKRESPENFFPACHRTAPGLGICRGNRSLRTCGHCDVLR